MEDEMGNGRSGVYEANQDLVHKAIFKEVKEISSSQEGAQAAAG